MLKTKIINLNSKLSFLTEPLKAKISSDDLSVSDFIERKFSKEIADKLFSAYLSGIWSGDITKLSARSVLSKIWDLNKNHNSIIIGGIKSAFSKTKKKRKSSYFTFNQGLITICKSIEKKLQKTTLLLHSKVESIEQGDEIKITLSNKNIINADCLFITSNFSETNKLLNLNLAEIYYAPVGLLHLAIEKKDLTIPLEGFGFLVPATEDTAIIGCIYTSTIFENRAPEGFQLISCFCGGALREELADITIEENRARAIREIQEVLNLKNAPKVVDSFYSPKAIPNYHVNHFKNQEEIDAFHRNQNKIRILANWDRGISLANRLEEVKTAVNFV